MSTTTVTESKAKTKIILPENRASTTSARAKQPQHGKKNNNKLGGTADTSTEKTHETATKPAENHESPSPPTTARTGISHKNKNNHHHDSSPATATVQSSSPAPPPPPPILRTPSTFSPSSSSSPALAQREYISELRIRQNSQLASVASYLETHAREPFGALCGKNLGGWTYGPSYSRTVESLDPEAESYPPTKSSRRTVILSSARSLPYNVEQELRKRSPSPSGASTARSSRTNRRPGSSMASSSRPNTARSNISTFQSGNNNDGKKDSTQAVLLQPLIRTSFYNVVLEAPFNVRPTSSRFCVGNGDNIASGDQASYSSSSTSPRGFNLVQQEQKSARPLSSEYYYPTRQRALKNDELVSKSDLAVQKHREKQQRLELQKEKLKNAAPMEFRWQL